MVLRRVVQNFERPPFWNGCRYGIQNYGVEVTINGVKSLQNYIKICQLAQKFVGEGTGRRTDRMVISLEYYFL
jgi:hypothetical protein